MKAVPGQYHSPQWQPSVALLDRVSATLKQWLLDKGSLTRRLTNLYQGQFYVEVLEQHWGTPNIDEAKALSLSTRDKVLVREVILHGAEQPRVYARSIIPSRSLVGRVRALTQLGDRPLGAWLFQQPDLRRGAIEVANFSASNLPLPTTEQQAGWGRRSVFYVDDKPLLVCEIFLQSLVDDIERSRQP
ncbi:MAG: chorismate lyase [Pseudomonadota bacterium]